MPRNSIENEFCLDDRLMLQCQKGEAEAFNQIVQRHRTALVTFIARLLGDRETAEDLAQESLLRMYRAANRYKAEGSTKFTTWMYHIASNLCKNELRNRNRRQRHFIVQTDDQLRLGQDLIATAPADPALQPDQQLVKKEQQSAVQNAISLLPETYRLPLVLRDIQGLSYNQVSATLKLPLGTVKSRINRARLMLKDLLKPVVSPTER
jgi:RNA polymerase sigma-70 factor (ECF subfamily)